MRMQVIHEDYSEKTAAFPFVFRYNVLTETQCVSYAVLPAEESEESREALLAETESVCPVTWHKNVEILYFEEGEGTVLCNGKSTAVTAGDIFAVNPNHLHTVLADKTLKYYSLIADAKFCEKNGIGENAVTFRNGKTNDDETVASFRGIIHAFHRPQGDVLRILAINSSILMTLYYLCEKHAEEKAIADASEHSMDTVKDVLRYIDEHLSETITLDDVAAVAGVSRFYFSSLFHKKVGMSLFSYINLSRCNRAKMLLSCGSSVSDAYRQCGFDNFSYFSKTFKHYVGILPSEYRAAQRIQHKKSAKK